MSETFNNLIFFSSTHNKFKLCKNSPILQRSLTYIDIAKTFEQTYFVTDYAGGSGDSGALNELTIAFGETMDGMPDIRITVSENGYIQINGKRAYPLSLKYAGKRLYVHLLGCLQDGADLQQ